MLFDIPEIDLNGYEYDNQLESTVVEKLPKHLLRKFKKLSCNNCSAKMKVGLINLRRDITAGDIDVSKLATKSLDGCSYVRATRKRAKRSWQRVMMQVRACEHCRKFAWTGDIHEIDCDEEIETLLARMYDNAGADESNSTADGEAENAHESVELDVKAFVEQFHQLEDLDPSNL